jgi:hypothetical protein
VLKQTFGLRDRRRCGAPAATRTNLAVNVRMFVNLVVAERSALRRNEHSGVLTREKRIGTRVADGGEENR